MIAVDNLDALSQTQLRQTVELLMTELRHKSALVAKLTHEMAVLKRLKYAATSEKFCAGLPAEQKSLLEETLDTDLAQLRIGISNGLWKPVGSPTDAWAADSRRPGRPGTGICTVVLS